MNDEALKYPIGKFAAQDFRLDRLIAMYAWHGDHHLGHLKIVAEKSN